MWPRSMYWGFLFVCFFGVLFCFCDPERINDNGEKYLQDRGVSHNTIVSFTCFYVFLVRSAP